MFLDELHVADFAVCF